MLHHEIQRATYRRLYVSIVCHGVRPNSSASAADGNDAAHLQMISAVAASSRRIAGASATMLLRRRLSRQHQAANGERRLRRSSSAARCARPIKRNAGGVGMHHAVLLFELALNLRQAMAVVWRRQNIVE